MNDNKEKKRVTTPLIKVKLQIENKLQLSGIYDSGSNVSLINATFLKINGRKNTDNDVNLITINGVKRAEGLTTLKVNIFKIEKEVDVYIIEGYKYDFLIGLDMIKEFRLSQDMNLEISQNNELIEGSKVIISTLTEDEQSTKKENSNSTCSKVNKNKNNIEKYEVNFNEHIPSEKFEIEINHLSLFQQNEIDKIINKHKSSFAKDKYDIGTVKNLKQE